MYRLTGDTQHQCIAVGSGRPVKMWSIAKPLLIDSSLDVIPRLIGNVEQYGENGLSNILLGVHHIYLVWLFVIQKVREIPEARLVGPGVPHTISLELAWICRIILESVQLIKYLLTGQHRRRRVCDNCIFREILGVLSELMVSTKELPMQIKARILATLGQPNELHSSLALWAWEPTMHEPANE